MDSDEQMASFNDALGVPYGDEVRPNDTLRVVLDNERNRLGFILNDKSYGDAFKNVLPQEYHAAVSLFNQAEVRVRFLSLDDLDSESEI